MQDVRSTLRAVLTGLDGPFAIAFDPVERLFYWTTSASHYESRPDYFIGRASLDGKSQKILISNVTRPYGLAVDARGRNLYWTDNERKTIEVSKLDGSFRKLLVNTHPQSPVDIVLDTKRG